MRRFTAVLIAAFAIVGTAVAGFSAAGVVGGKSTTHALAETTVNIDAREFSFTLSQSSAPAGIIHFVIKNIGKISHNFVIAGQQSLVISAGKTGTLDVTLTKGKYKYLCSITGHAALGMKGTLTAA